jgi:hypothetical protein
MVADRKDFNLAIKPESCYRTTDGKLPFLYKINIYQRKFYENYRKSRNA